MPSRTPSSRPRRATTPSTSSDSAPSHTCPPGGCNHSSHGTMHAARGAVSVWLAALMAVLSFAVLATLSSNAYAQSSNTDSAASPNVIVLLRQMNSRMERMEALLKKINTQSALSNVCVPKEEHNTTTTPAVLNRAACEERCAQANALCVKSAGDKQDSREVCISKAETCRKACNAK